MYAAAHTLVPNHMQAYTPHIQLALLQDQVRKTMMTVLAYGFVRLIPVGSHDEPQSVQNQEKNERILMDTVLISRQKNLGYIYSISSVTSEGG